MAGSHSKAFTSDHLVREDGSVEFTCSQDDRLWPWTQIGAHHPGAIQAASYWLSVESAAALGQWDPDKWSALTWTRWTCGEPAVGRMAHGRYQRSRIEGKESFSVHLYDAGDSLICELDGRGVVFRTRDFEKWRSNAKRGSDTVSSADLVYADRALLGLSGEEFPFIGDLENGRATGLLDQANCMPPAHPWLDGSGDHVNSAHIAEVARQFTSLLRGGKPFRVTAAEMRFDRYVELGVPFMIERTGVKHGNIEMKLCQSGRDCTAITYTVAAA